MGKNQLGLAVAVRPDVGLGAPPDCEFFDLNRLRSHGRQAMLTSPEARQEPPGKPILLGANAGWIGNDRMNAVR